MQKISVIIPLHNKEAFIVDCLESLSLQSHDDFEVIVIDDGSTDNSRMEAELYLAVRQDQRFRFYTRENRGVSATLNEAIKQVQGSYFTRLDADDVLHPEALARLAELASQHGPDLVVAGMSPFAEHETLRELSFEELREKSPYISGGHELLPLMFGQADPNYMSMGATLYRRAFIEREGILLNEQLSNTEDLLFNASCYARAKKVISIDEKLYFYRKTSGSLSRAYRPQAYKAVDALAEEVLFDPEFANKAAFERYEKEIVHYLNLYYALSLLDEHKGGSLKNYGERIDEFMSESYFHKIFEMEKEHAKFVEMSYTLAREKSYAKMLAFSNVMESMRSIRRNIKNS